MFLVYRLLEMKNGVILVTLLQAC